MKSNWDKWFSKHGKWNIRFQYFVWRDYDKLLNNIELKNPKILELGCGSGVITNHLLEKYGG